MKAILSILIITLLTVSCGKNATYVPKEGTTDVPASNDGLSESTSLEGSNYLVAKKTYTPEAYEVGELVLDQGYNAMIPAELVVKKGNGGNWTSELHLDNLICVYKAQSTMTNPLFTGNTHQITLGQKYVFQFCKNNGITTAHSVGSQVFVQEKVRLAIKHGDSQALTEIETNVFLSK